MSDENQNGLLAFKTLGEFLDEDGWYPQQREDALVYQMGFAGRSGRFTVYAIVRDDLEQLLLYAIAPNNVPEDKRRDAAEFITRANYGLRIGNFEMDFSDGEIRYKSSLDFEDEVLSPALIKNAIYPAVQTMDRYFPGLMSVIFAGKTPVDAIAEIENPAPADDSDDE